MCDNPWEDKWDQRSSRKCRPVERNNDLCSRMRNPDADDTCRGRIRPLLWDQSSRQHIHHDHVTVSHQRRWKKKNGPRNGEQSPARHLHTAGLISRVETAGARALSVAGSSADTDPLELFDRRRFDLISSNGWTGRKVSLGDKGSWWSWRKEWFVSNVGASLMRSGFIVMRPLYEKKSCVWPFED